MTEVKALRTVDFKEIICLRLQHDLISLDNLKIDDAFEAFISIPVEEDSFHRGNKHWYLVSSFTNS